MAVAVCDCGSDLPSSVMTLMYGRGKSELGPLVKWPSMVLVWMLGSADACRQRPSVVRGKGEEAWTSCDALASKYALSPGRRACRYRSIPSPACSRKTCVGETIHDRCPCGARCLNRTRTHSGRRRSTMLYCPVAANSKFAHPNTRRHEVVKSSKIELHHMRNCEFRIESFPSHIAPNLRWSTFQGPRGP